MVGRSGRASGDLFAKDVATGAWKSHRYEVSSKKEALAGNPKLVHGGGVRDLGDRSVGLPAKGRGASHGCRMQRAPRRYALNRPGFSGDSFA